MNKVLMGFAVFALTAGAPAAFGQEGDAEAGKTLFAQKCGFCHNVESKDKANKPGPALYGVSEGKLPSGKDTTPENILHSINEGGTGMPPFKAQLKDEEKNNLVAYIMKL